MSIENDVDILKRQVLNFLTRAQITALIAALGADHTTLEASVNDLVEENNTLKAEIQSLKDTLADHEARLVLLE